MMSPSDFDSLLATLDLLSDPQIMAQIARSKRAMRRAPLYTLDELISRVSAARSRCVFQMRAATSLAV